MFTAALFTIGWMWKQPKCPSIEERIKKTGHIYTYIHIHATELYSSIKRNKTVPFLEM